MSIQITEQVKRSALVRLNNLLDRKKDSCICCGIELEKSVQSAAGLKKGIVICKDVSGCRLRQRANQRVERSNS